MAKVIYTVLKLFLIIMLPFLLLIRGSVYLHEKYDPGPVFSLTGGMVLTTLLLVIYFTIFYSFVVKKGGGINGMKKRGIIALLIVAGYCIQGLFFISASNIKSPDIKKELRELHPIIRIAVSTIIFIDRDLIITDASRRPEDYRKMGLPGKVSSLHYKQKDSYAYAMDLRTNSRSEVRNFLMVLYFKLMGFRTLRHTGTGDHLHISLTCHYRPGAI